MIKEDLTVSVKVIDARLMQKAFLAGAKGLEAKKEWINELNVFPVPACRRSSRFGRTLS